VARTIVAILARATSGRPILTNSWQAYDYYLQAVDAHDAFMSSFSVEDLHESGRLLEVRRIDRQFAARRTKLMKELRERVGDGAAL
jgi:hypothetical protein